MLWLILCALPLLAGGAAVYYRSWGFLPFAGGALLGTAVNAAKVLLLERTVNKLAAMEGDAKAASYARLQGMLRFLLTALALAGPAFANRRGLPIAVFWGAAAAALAYQLAVYTLKMSEKKRK
ncbi:MAG: hypothetical protein FWE98_07970 [Oscillospiraceae bacterium]|nr:hypothetical protein [Oscillospiraceae bacterium]